MISISSLQNQWLTIIFLTGKLADQMRYRFMIVVWIISMILWSLVICFLRYNFSDFPLALFTLVLLILSFVVLLRFAFNLSNYELAIDDK